jgi:LuxR family maltose regulon positive regulatory protein
VPRPRLVRPLLGSADLPLALLIAPAGYGKTTVLSQWAERDRRPFAWVTLDEGDNDPARLLASIGSVLDAIEPLEEDGVARRSDLLRALERRSRSFVLVLDDVHVLRSAKSIDLVTWLVDHMPWGSQVALASRDEPGIPVGRLRANREVVELRFGDLAMTPSEAAALLSMAGAELGAEEVETIVRRTEGWPAGLYLAALSLRDDTDPGRAVAWFGGHDRLVADYVRDEMLAGVSRAQVSFLMRASVLGELSGPLCDAVLERPDSARVLADLARSNVMLFATQDPGRYRYHGLLAQMLRSELRRSEPEREADLHRRAAAWHSDHGDIDSAVTHAIAARDAGLVGDLLWANLPRYLAYGRNDKVKRWLDSFTDSEIATHPALALVAAFSQLALGDGNLVEHWTSAAYRCLGESTAPAGASFEAAVALLRAAVAANGTTRMLEDADRAYELFAEEDPWRSICCLLVGVAQHLSGERGRARAWLEEGARRGAVGAPVIQALCLAQLALLAIDEDDWADASAHALRARAQVERYGISGYPACALVYAVAAVIHTHNARIDEAKIDLRCAEKLIGQQTDFAPWYRAEVFIALARASLPLSETVAARVHLANATRLLRRAPEAVVLAAWLEDSWLQADLALGSSTVVEWSLTTAELRVLQFLPTHLSLPEIAKELNVSANTVKTHTRAVYRKLDASSRTEAVSHARRAGLIEASRFTMAAAA